MNILFICTGNTCRSPMAAAILKHKFRTVHVKSAGTFANENDRANPNTVNVLRRRNIDIDHTSQQVTDELLQWADYVFTMTEGHRQQLLIAAPQHEEKYYVLKQFVYDENNERETRNFDVSDPFGGSLQMYEKTYEELDHLLTKLIEKIK